MSIDDALKDVAHFLFVHRLYPEDDGTVELLKSALARAGASDDIIEALDDEQICVFLHRHGHEGNLEVDTWDCL